MQEQFGNISLKAYHDEIALGKIKDVLEIGTLRSNPDVSTHHKRFYSYPVNYVMTDIQPGLDVDIVSDAHDLSSVFGFEMFDAIYSASTFEHLSRPWIAAEQIELVLKRGGVFCIQTHFTFGEHGYPNDYFRFTTDGLKSLFYWATDVVTCYEFPCKIIHDIFPEGQPAPTYLNVNIFGRKK